MFQTVQNEWCSEIDPINFTNDSGSTMTRKQEIYREMLSCSLPASRNALSRLHGWNPLRLFQSRYRRFIKSSYELAELTHNLYETVADEDFRDHDIWFLNHQARSFYDQNNEQTCYSYSTMVNYIQELFKIVPEELRDKLDWEGPKGDYSHGRPKSGHEIMHENQGAAEESTNLSR